MNTLFTPQILLILGGSMFFVGFILFVILLTLHNRKCYRTQEDLREKSNFGMANFPFFILMLPGMLTILVAAIRMITG